MDNQHQEFRIGLTVLVALAALVFLIVMFGKGPSIHFGDEYSVRVRFQRTPGISKRSPVYKNGVQIGKVTKVELVDDDREVEVTIRLSKNRKIYTNEECRVRQTMIMGDASLEFVKLAKFTGKVEEIDPDKPLVGGTPTDLMSGFSNIEGDLTKAIHHVSDAALQMSGFIERTNLFMGTPEELTSRSRALDSVVQEMQLTMQSTRRMTDGADKFLNDPQFQTNVKRVVESMPDILEKSRNLVTESNLFVADARNLLERGTLSLDRFDTGMDKAGKALDSVLTITESVESDVSEFMGSLKKSADKLQTLFDDISTIIQAVNNADGTIKRIMRSPEMYEKLMETLDNVQTITAEVDRMLRTDIKPITTNVKIITDKVARDPSVFIRNLLRKQPRTKGHLPIWGDGLGSDTLGDPVCHLERFAGEAMHRDTVYYGLDSPVSIEGSIPASRGVSSNIPERFDSIPDAPKLQDGPVLESPRAPFSVPSIGKPVLAPELSPEWKPDESNDGQRPAPAGTPRRLSTGERLSSFLPRPNLPLPSFFKKTHPDPLPVHSDQSASDGILPDGEIPLLALTPPRLLPGSEESGPETEPQEDEGRIICVDPRYLAETTTDDTPVYRQMSYEEETETEPMLRFTPKQ